MKVHVDFTSMPEDRAGPGFGSEPISLFTARTFFLLWIPRDDFHANLKGIDPGFQRPLSLLWQDGDGIPPEKPTKRGSSSLWRSDMLDPRLIQPKAPATRSKPQAWVPSWRNER